SGGRPPTFFSPSIRLARAPKAGAPPARMAGAPGERNPPGPFPGPTTGFKAPPHTTTHPPPPSGPARAALPPCAPAFRARPRAPPPTDDEPSLPRCRDLPRQCGHDASPRERRRGDDGGARDRVGEPLVAPPSRPDRPQADRGRPRLRRRVLRRRPGGGGLHVRR